MQYRCFISAVLVPVMLLQFSGCTKTVWIGPSELQPEQKLKGVVTADGREVKLDPLTAALRGDTIYSGTGDYALRFAVNEVERVGVERPNRAATAAVVVGVLLVVALALGAAAAASDLGDFGLSDSPFQY